MEFEVKLLRIAFGDRPTRVVTLGLIDSVAAEDYKYLVALLEAFTLLPLRVEI